jgi:hypothetical protein
VDIQYVAQEHPFGCGIACVAMITGQSYAQVLDQMGGEIKGRGTTHFEWFEALAEQGFAVQFIFQRQQKIGRTPIRKIWPLAPWAPVHIVQIVDHSVVMRNDGTIFNPARPRAESGILKLTDYPEEHIYAMVGIFPVNSRPLLETFVGCPRCELSIQQRHNPGHYWCAKSGGNCWHPDSVSLPDWCPGFRLP